MTMLPVDLAAFCHRLTWVFAHFLWEGAAVALLAGAVSAALPRPAARARYAVWVAALGLLALCPLATWAFVEPPASGQQSPAAPMVPAAVLPAPTPASPPAPADPAAPSPAVEAADTPAGPAKAHSAALSAAAHGLRRLAPYLMAAYALGVAAMLARLLLAVRGGRRLIAGSRPVDEPGILAAFERHARAMGLADAPALAFCRRITAPTVIGLLRPMVLLPAALVTSLAPQQVEAILLHELAHIRRCDHLVNFLQRIVEAALFFHPAVWYVSRRIRAEREHCCDDVAVALGGRPDDYAELLLRIAEQASRSAPALATALGAASRPSELRRRIEHILGQPARFSLRLSRAWPGLLAVSAVLGLAAGSYLFAHGKLPGWKRWAIAPGDDGPAVDAVSRPTPPDAPFVAARGANDPRPPAPPAAAPDRPVPSSAELLAALEADADVRALRARALNVRTQLAAAQRKFAARHPRVRTLEAEIERLGREIATREATVARTLRAAAPAPAMQPPGPAAARRRPKALPSAAPGGPRPARRTGLVARICKVDDLIRVLTMGNGRTLSDAEAMAELVRWLKAAVAPESWSPKGPGTATGARNGQLVVYQTAANDQAVQAWLTRMRRALRVLLLVEAWVYELPESSDEAFRAWLQQQGLGKLSHATPDVRVRLVPAKRLADVRKRLARDRPCRLLSSPRLVLTNGQAGRLFVGTQGVLPVPSADEPGKRVRVPISDGLSLKLTPSIPAGKDSLRLAIQGVVTRLRARKDQVEQDMAQADRTMIAALDQAVLVRLATWRYRLEVGRAAALGSELEPPKTMLRYVRIGRQPERLVYVLLRVQPTDQGQAASPAARPPLPATRPGAAASRPARSAAVGDTAPPPPKPRVPAP